MPNCIIGILALAISIMLCVLYFNKERIRSFENKIYSLMIMTSFLMSAFAVLFYFVTDISIEYCFIRNFIGKGILILFLLWATLFAIYLVSLIYIEKKKINYKNVKNIPMHMLIPLIVFFAFLSILVIILPLYYHSEPLIKYSYGPAANIVFIGALLVILLSNITLLLNINKIFNKKFVPIYLFVSFSVVIWIVQKNNPGILLTSFLDVFITLIMYHTIENPDMKLINELELARDNADRANRAKTEFLSSMSHEIRTPLNAIVGFSNAILDDESITEAQDEARDIVMASQNLLEIVNGILDISKIEAGKMEIVNTNYDLEKNALDIAKLIKPRIGNKDIKFNVDIESDLPDVLYGDIGKIKEVITNLLTNAVKYTEKGIIEFKINCINNKTTSKIIISVEDTGRGIKPDKINKLFTKFQRLDEDKNTTLEGTGLGLAITKSLVEMMGGKIIVQSKYGSGSKFTVYLSQKIVKLVDKSKRKETVDSDNSLLSFENKKVLVVDDNKLNLKVASRFLNSYKVDIDLCESGMECLEKVKKNNYDLILLDDMMPKMSGKETFHKLKENKKFNTPVVVLTANAITGMKDEYLKEGFDDYLAKPIDKLELKRVLNTYLKK